MKTLVFLTAAGLFLALAPVASAGNINPMSQRYTGQSFARQPTARQERAKPPKRQRQQQQPQQGGSQY